MTGMPDAPRDECEKLLEQVLAALIEERALRQLSQCSHVHWESLRDLRRACYAATDAAIKAATS